MAWTEQDLAELEGRWQEGGAATVLEALADRLRTAGEFHALFEALKMRVRHELGLPLLRSAEEVLSESEQGALEEGLFAACREVGNLLLSDGQIRDAALFLRAGGDLGALAAGLAQIQPTPETMDEWIEVTLQEGIDPPRGLELVLEHYGLCQAITAFESALPGKPRSVQQAAAAILVRHVHDELLASVRAHIGREQGPPPNDATLEALVVGREWLFADLSYHIDTTHLAAVVRFARLLDDPEMLRMAVDLTVYGQQLGEPFQYPGEPPFRDFYRSHGAYFRVVLGEEVETGLAYFLEQARAARGTEDEALAVEVYLDLLARADRPQSALAAAQELLPATATTPRVIASLGELAARAGDYGPFLEYCRQRREPLGFVAALVSRAAGRAAAVSPAAKKK